ncbi:DNA mismatch endonuclease Vsr [Bacillus idriensis]|uniref:Very short patch repair endonuclease n=1 Tax=Metabacillus idriensis TaxID=324768 RepID=A0A6I2M6P2_9BACI|nr:very short patch repair endonuclease [Metabacillus idriensis]MRX53004.1 DNA mismatch endonuclease Vsr [Metabacillus idriensis]
MPERITAEQRSKNMKAIKSQSKLENKVTQALWHRGIRFRKNAKLFGKPDISIKKYKVVVFIDSCFWHSCPIHGNMPKSNYEYWSKKLKRNTERDIEVNKYYKANDWNILRVWEHDLKKNFDATVKSIEDFILNAAKIDKKTLRS